MWQGIRETQNPRYQILKGKRIIFGWVLQGKSYFVRPKNDEEQNCFGSHRRYNEHWMGLRR